MTENRDEDRMYAPPRKRIGSFFRSWLSTGIPFLVLFVLILGLAGRGGELVWMAVFLLWLLTLLVSAGFAIAGKGRISLGILAGAAVGLTGLVVSCSTVLATPSNLP